MSDFIDAHCHLSDPRLAPFLDALLADCAAAGITGFVQGGVDPVDWERQRELGRRYTGRIFPCFGLHPWFVAASERSVLEPALARLPEFLGSGVGIGELGLDFGRRCAPGTYSIQKEFFAAQLKLVPTHRLPLVLHIVQAHGEALQLLRAHAPYPLGGIVHSFGGGIEVAREYLALGLVPSLGGSVARAKGHETLKRAVAALGKDDFVLETDSPDQLPDGFTPERPGLNDPRSLFRVAEAVASLRNPRVSPAELLHASRERIIRIFGLRPAS